MTSAARPGRTAVPPGTGHYPELTSLRAVAAIAVVGTHAAFWTGHYRGTGGLLWARLDFGVALFFVLSGFLLFRSWIAAASADRAAPSTRRYFGKRAVRILPGYWITVIAAFLLVDSDVGTGGSAFVRTLTFTQVYGGNAQHRGLTQMWSLCVEVAFYLLLPLFGWFAVRVCCRTGWRPGRLLAFVGAIALVTPAWYVVTREIVTIDLSSIFWLPGYLNWFAIGMALSVLAVQHERDPGRSTALRTIAAAPGSCWLMAVAVLAIAATPVAGEATLVPLPLFEALAKNLLYLTAAGLIVAPMVLGASGGQMLGWLRWRPLMWLGDISYEIFLVHLIVIEAVLAVLDYPVFSGSVGYVFVLTTAASVPVAWALRRGVDGLLRWRDLTPPDRHDRDEREGRDATQLDRPRRR